MVDREQLKTLRSPGRQIDSKDYCGSCRIHNAKTFYFFCKRLASESKNTELPSTDLNGYIFSEVRLDGVSVKKSFNPYGWFGKDWTDWERSEGDRPSRLFRWEFCDVLLRTREQPYSYRVRAEYFDLLKDLFSEFAVGH
jgi:hypothetical protein